MKKLILLAIIGLGFWGYQIYKDGGDPAKEIGETLSREASDFKDGFERGYRATSGKKPKSEASSVEYPSDASERLELPRLSRQSGQYFVVHEVDGQVNYSLEYDAERHHSRWVAFTFDDDNSADRVGRMDTWAWDPKLPQRLSTENDFRGSGYSRGHLVASEDRVWSKEANMQTFYYSNISPQLQEHNSGVWKRLEEKVRSWGRNSRMRRVMYVAKGGTIADGQIESRRVRNRIVIPKYYWMALLAEDNEGEYHAIAFLTEHRAYARGEDNLKRLAVSVDELESFTGLDLFHNLDDEIEDRVEAESPDGGDARRYWW
ncbi:MAG: DNA/RNA non-specific endonuclease [Porphyromonas sp.]|nr:DNA/RNA non-specific endonuclease [Porphyromonas sp.]